MRHALRLLLAALALLALTGTAAAAPRAQTAAERQAEAALEEAASLRDGRGVETGRELTEALRKLARRYRHLSGEQRAEAKSLLARPTDSPAQDEDAYQPGLTVQRQCGANFCVHYVESGSDAATASFAAAVLAEAVRVRAFENGTLGWRSPPSDTPLGGDSRTDIYLKEVGGAGLFGFAATDPQPFAKSMHSYLVLDNDYDPTQFGGVPAVDSMKVTLAHEYGHVLQYGYDVLADGWHYESSATWLEHAMYPELDDWLRYLYDIASGPPGWQSLTELPLTAFTAGDPDSPDPRNAKPYGSVVWNHFLTGRHGADAQRTAWESSNGLDAPSTSSYDSAIRAAGGAGFASEFAAFSAAVAEWQAQGSVFPRPLLLPEVERVGMLRVDGSAVAPAMDHLTFALYEVPRTDAPRIRLAASFPRGMHGALALVGRQGDPITGTVTTRIVEVPEGGIGGVTLDQPGRFSANGGQITAVLVNADTRQTGWSDSLFDWVWSRDDQRVAAAVVSDLSGATVASRSPAPDAARVRVRSRVEVTFSKPVSGVNAQTFSLRRPNGRAVPASVSYAPSTRTAVLVPAEPLSDTTRYTARLTNGIVDGTATPLAPVEWSFTTVRRAPAARVKVLSGVGGATVRLRSKDADRVRWSARLVADGRTLASRRGRLKAGATRITKLRTARRGRARVVVALRDPQRNRKRIVRSVRLRPRG